MRRPLLVPLLLASLAALPACGDPTEGVVVRPQGGGTDTTGAVVAPLLLARDGEITFEVIDGAGLLGNVGAVSLTPETLQVGLVGQELGSGIAYVHVTGLTEGAAHLALTVDGEALPTIDLEVRAVADVTFDLPADGLEPLSTTMQDLSFDARSRVALSIVPMDRTGAPLYGRGVILLDATATTPLPCSIRNAGNRDQLVLDGAAPADYLVPLVLDGRPGRSITYHALAPTDAASIRYFGRAETDADLVSGDRVCLGVAAFTTQGTRIHAALADWKLGDKALEGGPASYVCYTYTPTAPPLTLAATFGLTIDVPVHGAKFAMHIDAASLASEALAPSAP
jgi:hypothetical protein